MAGTMSSRAIRVAIALALVRPATQHAHRHERQASVRQLGNGERPPRPRPRDPNRQHPPGPADLLLRGPPGLRAGDARAALARVDLECRRGRTGKEVPDDHGARPGIRHSLWRDRANVPLVGRSTRTVTPPGKRLALLLAGSGVVAAVPWSPGASSRAGRSGRRQRSQAQRRLRPRRSHLRPPLG